MLESLIIYALAVYWLFHVIARSDLLARPRAWVLRVLPSKVTYPLSCSFCFAGWIGILLTVTGIVWFSPAVLFAAPVINLVLDLCIRALIRANEPPVLLTPISSETTVTTTGASGVTAVSNGGSITWFTPSTTVNIPTVWIPTDVPPNSVYPEPHPSHVGRRVRVISGTTPDSWHVGRVGRIHRHYTDNSDSTINFRPFRYDIAFDGDDGVITAGFLVSDCLLLDEDPPPAAEIPA